MNFLFSQSMFFPLLFGIFFFFSLLKMGSWAITTSISLYTERFSWSYTCWNFSGIRSTLNDCVLSTWYSIHNKLNPGKLDIMHPRNELQAVHKMTSARFFTMTTNPCRLLQHFYFHGVIKWKIVSKFLGQKLSI